MTFLFVRPVLMTNRGHGSA